MAEHIIYAHRYCPSGLGAITATQNNESDDDFDGNDSVDEHQNGPLSSSELAVWQRSQHCFTSKDKAENDDPHFEDVLQEDFLHVPLAVLSGLI